MEMIGRLLDRVTLTGIGAAGFYLFFLNAGAPIPVSCLLAFLCMAAARHIVVHRPRRHRATRTQAEAALLRIAGMPEAAAAEALRQLTHEAELLPLLRHPRSQLSVDEVFELWRAHLGEEALVIASTCASESGVSPLIETLSEPRVRLIDRDALAKAIQVTGLFVPPKVEPAPLGQRLVQAVRTLLQRPLHPRVVLYGLSLIFIYRLTGWFTCLAAGLGLVGAAGVSWIHKYA